jgi:hypothetical protein
MNYKILEENSKILSIQIRNHREMIVSIALIVISILFPILTLLGITENIVVLAIGKITKDGFYSLLVFGYMVCAYALA